MHDGYQDRNHEKSQGQMLNPPAWLSTEELEDELLHAIQANAGEADRALAIIDEYFAGDDAFEPEPQHRQVLLWLLSLLRPRLADLLSCPPAE
jgi:hypothetical protein